MRAPRLALAAALFACVVPVAQAKPKPDKPEVVTHTYLVTTVVSGHYHGETVYTADNTDSFCPGTGSIIDADFQMVGSAKLRVKLDTNTSSHANLLVNDVGNNAVSGDLATIAMGDDCSALQNFHCTGVTGELSGLQSNNFAYAQGVGHKMVFGTEFTGPPGIDPNYTCFANEGDYYPGFVTNGVGAATQPYVSAGMAFGLTKLNDLKVGQQRSQSFKPVKGRTQPDYDVATCDKSTDCTGALTNFVHTITVKRIK